jgi:hypothetical protein
MYLSSSWSAATQPSVQASRADAFRTVSSSPIASLRYAAASSTVKRRLPARISTSSPRARIWASGIGPAGHHHPRLRRQVLQQVRHALLISGVLMTW